MENIIFLLLIAISGIFITYSYQLYDMLNKIQRKLGDDVFNWLTKEVEDEA